MIKPLYKVVTMDNHSTFVTGDRYKREYKKGKVVTAEPNSLGLFMFKTKRDAVKFSESYYHCTVKIKRVKPLAAVQSAKYACDSDQSSSINRYYRRLALIDKYKHLDRLTEKQLDDFDEADNMLSSTRLRLPDGTVCCQTVKVLD